MMASALDDEDLALSINPSHTRRGSTRSGDGAGDEAPQSSRPHTFSTPTQSQERMPAQTSSSQKTTHRLGQYEVISTLGEGSFGKVKLAVHVVSGQKVALKIINRRKLMARDMAGRVEREIQYLQLLRHPHIIKLYTVITTPLEIVMVLEYAGSELFNYIVDHGKMHEDKARQFFQQIVCAVEYCHRHKIVHRDLKPENLLLDENLHVKIADFGLSNIMTDGNFLKTSCGSPNYAAPEVISGKLYAGPEVDVWSCGVILYVLLVGKLPFDDEYIPSLFKKIAQGNYYVPHYLSPGAIRLIRKMLQVNPVHRITVEEIRQDIWFMKDLPEYLQPAKEKFYATGVDPNKAIDPKSLAPMKTPLEQDKIHKSVVGKLGKTMGYGMEDVQHALAVDAPNAIKDAYMIVRETQIMMETPSLAENPAMQPWLVGSPPGPTSLAIDMRLEKPKPKDMGGTPPTKLTAPRKSTERPRQSSGLASGTAVESRLQVSTISILPSSLPEYHTAFMRGQPKSPPPDQEASANLSADNSPKPSSTSMHSAEEAAATARRLKPHSKSQLSLNKMNKQGSFAPNQPPQKKPKPTKWQFGIRSRNQPAEAMLAIYKALKAMGGEWEVSDTRKPGGSSDAASPEDGDEGDDGSESGSNSDDDDGSSRHSDSDVEESHSAPDGSSAEASKRSSPRSTRRSLRGRERRRHRFDKWNDWGYNVPQDPWIINARFRKDGMFPPGVPHPASTNSSLVDLAGGGSDVTLDSAKQRSSRSSTLSSAASNHDLAAAESGGGRDLGRSGSLKSNRSASLRKLYAQELPAADESAWVYLTIQLYSIEKEFYLVDFKCAGYERLIRRLVGEVDAQGGGKMEEVVQHESAGGLEGEGVKTNGVKEAATKEELVGAGRATDEKDVSSPFPFLDVASRLIIQLAEAVD